MFFEMTELWRKGGRGGSGVVELGVEADDDVRGLGDLGVEGLDGEFAGV